MFNGMTVLVTGHTGFKGSWLTLWLQQLGAKVVGFSLPPPTQPSFFEVADLQAGIVHVEGDVRDAVALHTVVERERPELIFHLAAQSLVLDAFERPKETFDINVGGTVNLLEAARMASSVRAVVVVTTDKCYENSGWCWGYRENDRLGGSEPYSGSKAMAELAVAAYRSCFPKHIHLASVRAGNVIGGGDFSKRRLFPDIIRALMHNQPLELRHPQSVRPWLYVLDALYGYLLLAKQLLEQGAPYAEGWNFGPQEMVGVPVHRMVEKATDAWGSGCSQQVATSQTKHEMPFLRLNWEKAAQRLAWRPQFSWDEAVEATVAWFRAFQRGEEVRSFSLEQINFFERRQLAN